MFPKGAGYALKSYVGQENAFFNTWELTRRNVGTTRGSGPVRDIRLPTWPLCKQKAAVFTKFDPNGQLFRTGAHAPLMVWLGSKPRRSEESLWNREQNMVRRGWGPGSANRSRLMQAQDRGPPPWQREQDNVKGGTGEGAHGGDGKGGKVGKGEGIRGGGDHKGQKGGKGGWHRGGKDNTGGKGEGIRGGGDNKGQKGGQGGWHPFGKDNTGGKGEGIRGGGDGNGK
jgi:hypothetical protein